MLRILLTLAAGVALLLAVGTVPGCSSQAPPDDIPEEEIEETSMQMSGEYSEMGEELGEEAEPDLGTPGYGEEEYGEY